MKFIKLKAMVIALVLILSFFTLSLHLVETTKAAPSFEVYGQVDIFTVSNNTLYFPTVKMAQNGTLICMYRFSHDGAALYWKLSHDNGTTWVPAGVGNKLSSQGGGLLTVCPNGDILARSAVGDNTYDIYRSTDNGTSFQFDYNLVEIWGDDDGKMLLDRAGFSYGNNVYLNFHDDTNGVAGDSYYIYSTDNASTNTSWTVFGGQAVQVGGADEFCMVPLHGNGTWRTLHRDQFGWTYNKITHDDGVNWASTGEDYPASTRNYSPWAFWIDDGTIICCNEDNNLQSRIYESHNNMSSWTLVETLDASNSHYVHGCTMTKRPGNIGGWAFAVTSVSSCNVIRGWKIANNESLDWDWPPGPLDDDDDETTIAFDSINGEANNSILRAANRSFTWVKIAGATAYDIRVGNSTSNNNVTDIFLQLNNITVSDGNCTNTFLNTSDSASPHNYNYWESSTLCTFYLPYHFNITYIGYHYYQIRVRT